MQRFVFASRGQIQNLSVPAVAFQVIFEDRDQIFLFIIPNNQIDQRIFFQFILPHLGIASHGGHHGIRIQLLCPVQHLPGLPLCYIRHRTCIDDINIRTLFGADDLSPCIREHVKHSIGFILIDLASQSHDCGFHII